MKYPEAYKLGCKEAFNKTRTYDSDAPEWYSYQLGIIHTLTTSLIASTVALETKLLEMENRN